jgi:hypothetical protein
MFIFVLPDLAFTFFLFVALEFSVVAVFPVTVGVISWLAVSVALVVS